MGLEVNQLTEPPPPPLQDLLTTAGFGEGKDQVA